MAKPSCKNCVFSLQKATDVRICQNRTNIEVARRRVRPTIDGMPVIRRDDLYCEFYSVKTEPTHPSPGTKGYTYGRVNNA